MSWRLANALVTLRNGVNARWPNRDKTSDGTIGDAAHASRSSASDHNPWIVVSGVGVVRAVDIDVDGIQASWLAEQVRIAGQAGDDRLTGGGYVIYNRRITRPDWTGWNVYTGSNPHTSHVHISFSRNRAGFDSTRAWAFFGATTSPTTPPSTTRPTIQSGSTGTNVTLVQAHLKAVYPLYAKHLVVDGVFGPQTAAAVREFQRRSGLEADGIVGPRTWAALRI